MPNGKEQPTETAGDWLLGKLGRPLPSLQYQEQLGQANAAYKRMATEGMPITLEDKRQAMVKPDKSVWVGADIIGDYDPETKTIKPRIPVGWERTAEGLKFPMEDGAVGLWKPDNSIWSEGKLVGHFNLTTKKFEPTPPTTLEKVGAGALKWTGVGAALKILSGVREKYTAPLAAFVTTYTTPQSQAQRKFEREGISSKELSSFGLESPPEWEVMGAQRQAEYLDKFIPPSSIWEEIFMKPDAAYRQFPNEEKARQALALVLQRRIELGDAVMAEYEKKPEWARTWVYETAMELPLWFIGGELVSMARIEAGAVPIAGANLIPKRTLFGGIKFAPETEAMLAKGFAPEVSRTIEVIHPDKGFLKPMKNPPVSRTDFIKAINDDLAKKGMRRIDIVLDPTKPYIKSYYAVAKREFKLYAPKHLDLGLAPELSYIRIGTHNIRDENALRFIILHETGHYVNSFPNSMAGEYAADLWAIKTAPRYGIDITNIKRIFENITRASGSDMRAFVLSPKLENLRKLGLLTKEKIFVPKPFTARNVLLTAAKRKPTIEAVLQRPIRKDLLGRTRDAKILQGRTRDYFDTLASQAIATLSALKFPFTLDETGLVVFAKGVIEAKPNIKNASRYLGDILEKPKNYIWGKEARAYLKAHQTVEKVFDATADTWGISYSKALEHYSPRIVVAFKETPLERPSGFWSGFGSLEERPRYHLLGQEAMEEAGLQYVGNPAEAWAYAWSGLARRASRQQSLDILKPMVRVGRAARKLERQVNAPGYDNLIAKPYTYIGKNGKEITRYGWDVAKRLDTLFGERVGKGVQVAADASTVLRLSKAAFDDSVMTIHLLTPSFRHPKEFAAAFKSTLKTIFNDRQYIQKFMLQPKNMESALEYAYYGGLLGRSEYLEGVNIISKGLLKVPFAGAGLNKVWDVTVGRTTDAFTTGRSLFAVKMWQAMKPAAKRAGQLRELAYFINRSTGFFSLRGMGTSEQWQGVANAFGFFAPRFTLAMGTVLSDLPRGLLYQMPKGFLGGGKVGQKLAQTGAWRASWALEHLGALYLGGTSLYVATAYALGQEPKLDLRPKSLGGDGADAYSLDIGGYKVRLAGGILNMIRAAVAVGAATVDGDLENTITWLYRGIRSRTAPLTGVGMDLLTGRSFIGEPTRDTLMDFGEYIGREFVPIWMEATYDAWKKGQKPGVITAVAMVEFFGGSSFPEPEWDALRAAQQDIITQILDGTLKLKEPLTGYQRVLIQTKGGFEWNDLNEGQKLELRQLNPRIDELWETAWAETRRKWATDEEKMVGDLAGWVIEQQKLALNPLAEGFIQGKVTVDDYLEQLKENIRPQQRGMWAVYWWLRDYQKLTSEEQEQQKFEEMTQEDRDLETYKELRLPILSQFNEPQWEVTERRAKEYLDSLTPEIRAYVLRNQNNWIKELDEPARSIELMRVEDMNYIVSTKYWSLDTRSRSVVREHNVKLDATLAFWGYGEVRSDAAAAILEQKADKLNKPRTSVVPLVNWQLRDFMQKQREEFEQKATEQPPLPAGAEPAETAGDWLLKQRSGQ